VDFFGLRRHGIDRSVMGFVLRGSIGSLIEAIRGRRSWQEARRNWMAILTLPLVLLNLVDDFWNPFNDYAPRTASQPSTFFLVPFRNRPGAAPDGSVDRTRGVAYQISDVLEQARDVVARGDELAVHGIDAWRDADAGRAELNELAPVRSGGSVGLRMHWLYFAPDSPQAWDSTCGYNDAIGYRAGTSMAFRPLGVDRLLELPLTIMDSAMFYPRRMGLSQSDGLRRCHTIVEYARRFGGAVVINWHDRSLAPERLWGWCYHRLLADVATDQRAWFATMTQAVDWFNWRRSISFTSDAAGKVSVSASVRRPDLPGGRIVVNRRGTDRQTRSEEFQFDGTCALRLAV
jgi:peptidoglycan/xylan/chitin deacetylase (PgdA/CDA1 family)